MQRNNVKILYVALFIAVLAFAGYMISSSSTPSPAAVKVTSSESINGTVCCTFKVGDTLRTCAVTEGQTCDVCMTLCSRG